MLFVIFLIFILVIAFVCCIKINKQEVNTISVYNKGILTAAIVCLATLYIATHSKFHFKPAFYNINHHAIEHIGYSFEDEIQLFNKRDAIWIDSNRVVSIEKSNQNGSDFVLRNKSDKPLYKQKNQSEIYILQNGEGHNLNNEPYTIKFSDTLFSEKSFALTLSENTTHVLNVNIEFKTDSSKPLIFKGKFRDAKRPIKKGYNLYDLISESLDSGNNTFKLDQLQMPLLCEGLRKSIICRNILGEKELANDNYLAVFLSDSFFNGRYHVEIKGQNNNYFSSTKSQSIPIAYEDEFFWGCNYNNTTVLKISTAVVEGKKVNILKYVMPLDYSFETNNPVSKGDTLEYFAYSNADSLINTSIKQGFLFDQMPDGAFLNKINDISFLLKVVVSTSPEMTIGIDGKAIAIGENDFFRVWPDSNSTTKKTAWVFKNKNFYNRYDSLGEWIKHAGYVAIFLAVVVLIAFAFYAIRLKKKLSAFHILISLAMLALVTFRSFLSWRVAVFPPMVKGHSSELTVTVWKEFISNKYDGWLLWVLLAILIGFLTASLFKSTYFKENSLTKKITLRSGLFKADKIYNWVRTSKLRKASIILLAILLLSVSYWIAKSNPKLERVCYILIPVLAYLFIAYLLYRTNKGHIGLFNLPIKLRREKNRTRFLVEKKSKQLANFFINLFPDPVKFFINLVFLGFFAISDAGYAFIFIYFVLFYEFLAATSLGKYLRATIFIGAFFLFYLFNNSLLSFALNNIINCLLCAIVFLTGYVITVLLVKGFKKIRIELLVVIAIFFLSASLLLMTQSYVTDYVQGKTAFIKYRSKVILPLYSSFTDTAQMDTPIADELLGGIKYNNKSDINEIKGELQNQWFLSKFSSSYEPSLKPFELKPHFAKVQYIVQLRDVLPTRFILAEHGEIFIFLLLLVMLLPLYGFLTKSNVQLSEQKTNLQSGERETSISADGFLTLAPLLLLFFHGFFIFLTNTGKISFVGQDFPLLSLSSRLAILYPLFLLIIALIFSLRINYTKRPTIEYEKIQGMFNVISVITLPIILVSLVLFGAKQYKSISASSRFDASQPSTKNFINAIDSVYSKWVNSKVDIGLVKNDSINFADKAARKVLSIFIRENKDILSEVLTNRAEFNTICNKSILTDLTDTTNYPFLVSGDKILTISRKIYFNGNGNKFITLQFKYNNLYSESAPPHLQTNWQGSVKCLSGNNSDTAHQFLAKNLFVNGEQRMVYPLKDSFVWAYNFAKDAYRAMGQKNKQKDDILLTLDFNLTQKLLDILHNYKDVKSKHVERAIIVVDGNGNIRAMVDVKKDSADLFVKFNPNDRAARYKVEQQLRLYPDRYTQNDYYGNLNLLKCNRGPGSVLKPIVYNAVTSQLNLSWDGISKPDTSRMDSYAGENLAKHYDTPKEINRFLAQSTNLKSIRSASDYLAQSNNIYHSIIVFLGSYNKEAYKNERNEYDLSAKLKARNKNTDNKNTDTLNPKFTFNNRLFTLKQNLSEWPGISDANKNFHYFADPNSLLASGLNKNFHLKTDTVNKLSSNKLGRIAFEQIFAGLSFPNSEYTLPEASSFKQYLRDHKRKGASGNPLLEGIHQSVMGAYPFVVSPYKVAEMTGKLISQNPNYSLSIFEQDTLFARTKMDIDSTWNQNSYLQHLKINIFSGLKKVLTIGTGQDLQKDSATYKIDNTHTRYYLYAKTGTPGDSEGLDKLFTLVISEKNLEQINSLDDLAANKFYIVFFTNYDQGVKQPWELYRKVIDTITSSATFKTYMQ